MSSRRRIARVELRADDVRPFALQMLAQFRAGRGPQRENIHVQFRRRRRALRGLESDV